MEVIAGSQQSRPSPIDCSGKKSDRALHEAARELLCCLSFLGDG